MPAQPSWYRRVHEILDRLYDPTAPPFLDRPSMERLFCVGRRQAIRLMGACQGYQIGKTFLVERQSLIGFLEGFERSGVAPQARVRKQRVLTVLNEAGRDSAAQRIHIRNDPGRFNPGGSDLPANIQLIGPGKLQITYSGAEDLLARIVELVTSATHDFPAFRDRYEGCG